MSNSVRPHSQPPTRVLCPWDSPGKNIGVGCHFLLQCMKVKSESEVTQSCPTLSDLMDCNHQAPLSMGFSEQEYWSGLPFPPPGDLPHPGIKPTSPALRGRFFTTEPPGKYNLCVYFHCFLKNLGTSTLNYIFLRMLLYENLYFLLGFPQQSHFLHSHSFFSSPTTCFGSTETLSSCP